MAVKSTHPNDRYQPQSPAERELVEASVLVVPPHATRNHSNAELHALVRLLVLCTSRADRRLVALHLYHRIPLAKAAGLLHQTPAHAAEVYESLCARVTAAEAKRENDDRLRLWTKRENRGPRPKAGKE